MPANRAIGEIIEKYKHDALASVFVLLWCGLRLTRLRFVLYGFDVELELAILLHLISANDF